MNMGSIRVTIFKNGSDGNGKLVKIVETETIDDFKNSASTKCGFVVKRVFSEKGGEIDDISLIRDEDILYLSAGEPFKMKKARESRSAALMCDVVTLKRTKYDELYRSSIEAKKNGELTAIVFSRWCLEVFKDRVLVHCSEESPLKSAAGIKQAWQLFIDNPPDVVRPKLERVSLKVEEDLEIDKRVTAIQSNQRRGAKTSKMSWFSTKAQKVYWKFSGVIHDLSRVNWLDRITFDMLKEHLPEMTPEITAIIAIIHAEIEEFITSEARALSL